MNQTDENFAEKPIGSPVSRVIIGDSRDMSELSAESVGLTLTSPPYWNIKDYGVEGQLGYGQTLHEYLRDLYRVWMECHRVLHPGRRLCVNIGDQFARKETFGRYKIIPLHSEVITQCERIGFDYLGSIIWQKKTTMETSGGAVVMGSYPHPPNGIVELDYEYILLFRKPGYSSKVDVNIKERSKLSKEEWKEYFSGHWHFGGVRQRGHEAMFPEELPKRLIRMFSFVGETVLDPFLGSGTSVRASQNLGRLCVGYEINPDYASVIRNKLSDQRGDWQMFHQSNHSRMVKEIQYTPAIQDASPLSDTKLKSAGRETLHRVAEVIDGSTLRLQSGQVVCLMGVRIDKEDECVDYLRRSVVGKQVYVRTDEKGDTVKAYVYLKNKIFINSYLIKSGIGSAETSYRHKLSDKFGEEQERRSVNA